MAPAAVKKEVTNGQWPLVTRAKSLLVKFLNLLVALPVDMKRICLAQPRLEKLLYGQYRVQVQIFERVRSCKPQISFVQQLLFSFHSV